MKRADRLLMTASWQKPGYLIGMVLCAALSAMAALLLPNAVADAADAVLAGESSWPKIVWLLGLGAADILADVLGGIATVAVISYATAWLRQRTFAHLTDLGTHSPFAEGDAVSRLATDGSVAGGVAATVVQLGTAVVTSVGAIVLLILLDWRLALVFVLSVPFALFLARNHLRRTADDVLTYQEVSGEISARFMDAVRGLRTISAAGIADREVDRVLSPLPRLSAAGYGMWRTQGLMIWRAGLLLPAVEVAVLIAAGFGVLAGRLTIGEVLAALGYVALGMSLVGQIPDLTVLARARSGAQRIAEVLDAPGPAYGARQAPAGAGEVVLRQVTVSEALTEIDVTIPAGTRVAIVGRSGSGKSTLAGVIGRLHEPTAGEVLIDGVPVATMDKGELRAIVGYAFERPALLGETVSGALRYGGNPTQAGIESACRAAQIHDLVVRLPEGYQTPLRETPLSGGEAQRLGLARAFARQPRVLLLDDAMSSLDTVTESAVDDAMRDTLASSTKILVTHRVSMAARSDLVLWLENGQVRAFSPHALLWQDPDYRAVFTEQDSE